MCPGYGLSSVRLFLSADRNTNQGIFQDLQAFGDRCEALADEFSESETFNRKCQIFAAFNLIDGFSKKLETLEYEAQVHRFY